MKKLLSFATLLFIAGNGAQAQTVNDEIELQEFTRRYMAAYNAHDHVALGKMYTDDAVRIDQQGKEIKGADNIAAYFADQFRLNNATLLVKLTGVSWSDAEHALVAKGTYMVYGKTNVYDIPVDIVGSYANAVLKVNGEWKIAKSRLTPPDMSNIKAEIQALNNTWAKASNARDAATILDLYADDAISMPDGAPSLVGKAAIKKDIEASFAKRKKATSVAYETVDVYGNDHQVTEIGKTTVKDAAGKVVGTEKYMAVWEKRNGRWLVIREIYNQDAKKK